jgi:hypothetical protein
MAGTGYGLVATNSEERPILFAAWNGRQKFAAQTNPDLSVVNRRRAADFSLSGVPAIFHEHPLTSVAPGRVLRLQLATAL